MDRTNRLLRAACTALTAALMTGCSATMIARAMGFAAPQVGVYLIALAAAACVQLFKRGALQSAGAIVALALLFGALLTTCVPRIAALARALAGAEGVDLDALLSGAGGSVAFLCALLLGLLIAGLLRAPSGAPFALMVLLASVICALARREEISLWTALPGLIAGVAAFGLPSDARRDGVAPALLLTAAALAALALALTPGERVTWEPLERLAERVRAVVEDYVRFTEERMAFSIGEKGYDRAGMIGDDVVSMLGGPANPTDDAVMRVETDADLLLRGTIKRSYTGYSWVDDQTKARYLYYDFTHRGVRARVFDADACAGSDAFVEREASVEMLEGGTSTLFVPAQLAEFDMGLQDAVYYNSAGEIFLTRDVRAGDRYALRARVPASDAALIAEAAARADAADEGFDEARESYTALPPNIDTRVYALAVELTRDSVNAAEKAFAIQDYLARNYRYTLDAGYPEGNADFVSWFLLDSKEGYCSYFATAMAVMCRIAGLPARYVEGYAVEANPSGETIVTGENAHAWVEVYLNGMGWVAFDPTARARSMQGDGGAGGGMDEDNTSDGGAGDAGESDGESIPPDPDGGQTPEPDEPSPSLSPELGTTATPEPGAPSPTPENGETPPEDDSGDSDDSFPPEGEDADSPEEPERDSHRAWLWILLILLVLAALGWLIVRWTRRRLRETDPIALTARPEDMDAAALLLYRVTLTLLNQLGFAPQSGETPVAFSERVAEALDNADYLRFAKGVARCRYAGEKANAALVRDGRRAYALLLRRLSRTERLRFHTRRMIRGLGDTEAIP